MDQHNLSPHPEAVHNCILPVLVFLAITLPAFSYGEGPIAHDSFNFSAGPLQSVDSGKGWKGPWKISAIRPATFVEKEDLPTVVIQGTGERNNPLRRELAEPFRDRELFVRFRFRYDPPEDNSEFFVLWLDRLDGGDSATHGENVPNIGVHIADQGPKKGKLVFIVRIGPSHTAWSTVELKKGQTYAVVGRLSKSHNSERADFDHFDLWVDPKLDDLKKPDASIRHPQSVNAVRWIGFSTGRKTELTDRMYIDDLLLSRSWNGVLNPQNTALLSSAEKKKIQQAKEYAWNSPVDFKKDIYPLLKKRCFECHKGANSESGFRLDVHGEILGYSTGDPLAIPGKGLDSRIFERVVSDSLDERMPPEDAGDALTRKEIAMLRAWIDQGIQWDEKLLPAPNANSDHWAFQKVERPKIPAVDYKDWIRTPIDSFIAKKHQEKGLKPAPEASPEILVRRLFLDLTGLPPTPVDVAAFIKDRSPNAYDKLVEQLLASPHYGERWGRYWLDLARWAESHGYQHDIPRPTAWRYRDYVIDSFNQDKPFDRFLSEQLAGDELQPYSDENLIATGFLASARISGNNMDRAAQRNDVLIDIVNATGSAVLGLTMECAQCHNHKFDPISQRDYYRLQSFFVNGQLGNISLRDHGEFDLAEMENWMEKGAYKFYKSEAAKLIKAKKFDHTKKAHTWGFHSPASSDAKVQRLPVVNRSPISWDPESLRNTKARLLIRGDISKPGPELTSGWPEVFGKPPMKGSPPSRTDLAKWLTSRENPLVSRVWANRLWQYHFGKGIVSTPSNFGTEGNDPSHPELLDWLAVELMENGWSNKHLHRLIVSSAAYRQSRLHHESNASIDPENTLLWNWPRRRLEAEAIRDSVLVATGEFDQAVGGPGVPPHLENESPRRTIYLYQRRNEMPPVMSLFDAPEGIASCSGRRISTVALQPLYLLNSDFMMKQAESLAEKVTSIAGKNPEDQAETAFLRTLGRIPDADEQSQSLALLTRAGDDESKRKESLVRFCHALLNLNEFVYIP